MSGNDDIIQITTDVKAKESAREATEKETALDYFSLAITTFGVGYLPLAPGTYGSAVGVLIYLLFGWIEASLTVNFGVKGWTNAQITAWIQSFNLIAFLLFCLLGIWASNRAVKIFQNKDPQQAVVDEVIGQLITFLFVPFAISWHFVLAGFLLFRLFDIWKPYPIDSLQNLPAGIGVCADDILAGIYAGTCLSLIYAISLTV